ncbi:MAG: heparinase II/III family protein, partial [Pseudonocardiaceae bacterium]
WLVLMRMTDALAAILDTQLRPPRQGDADDGHGLILDGAGTDRWASLLASGEALFGRLAWWPAVGSVSPAPRGDVRTPLLTSLTRPHRLPAVRPANRPAHFADAGLTILRIPDRDAESEIWCRCDGGPHGFTSIAAHAHADALSLEVRHGGVDVLADPGTFCYHGEPEWRSYFRSTLGHNTLELDGADQSRSGGPFLWTRHAGSRVLVAHAPEGDPENGIARWCAEHDGYSRRRRPAVHRRSVELDGARRELRVFDEVHSPQRHRCRIAFHLGPRIAADLVGHTARLRWTHAGREHAALLELPLELSWTAHRGQASPPLGWYSPGYGRREPAPTMLGSGVVDGTTVLTTLLRFSD